MPYNVSDEPLEGFAGLLCAVVYRPPGSDGQSLSNHLFESLAIAEANFPNYGVIIAWDFNRLNVSNLTRHFKLKQLVKSPTRGHAILDLVLTNLHRFYSPVEHFPPFGLSDHHTVLVKSSTRSKGFSSKKTITIRDTKPSNKLALGRYLCNIDWSIIDQVPTCEEKLELFNNLVHIGLELITPVKQIRITLPMHRGWRRNLKV